MATSHDPRVARIIAQIARRSGLDPEAVLSVGAVEGGIRAQSGIGDNGTSFGPFQLHWQGAMPKKYWGNAAASQAFANSPAGYRYAIQQMARVAKGLRGQAAVEAIVHKFERPAAPGPEVERAMGHYGSFKAGSMKGGSAQMPSSAGSGIGSPAESGGDQGAMLAMALLGNATARARGQQTSLLPALLAFSQQREELGAAQEAFGPEPKRGSLLPAAKGGPVRGSIAELFYDPLGGVKNGQLIDAIGGHDDHEHFATENPRVMAAVEARAKALGLAVREDGVNDRVDPVHTKGSYHYRKYGGKFGDRRKATDISGDPQRMAELYRWILKNYR